MPQSNKNMLDLYSDYLLSSFSYTTATGMSAILDNEISHDKITRFLSDYTYNSKDLWKLVKPVIRKIETEDGVIIFDDTTEEKEYTDENDIIAWHFDHSKGRSVKGINILSGIYHNNNSTIPVAFEIIKKNIAFIDPKTDKRRRKSDKTKNELFREMLLNCIHNRIKFKYTLGDIWFSSKENMEYVLEHNRHFIFAIKKNRLVALTKKEKLKGNFKNIESLKFEKNKAISCYFKGINKEMLITRQVFTNEDGSTGILYLATSDTDLDFNQIKTIYQKRWKVEEYHKSIKSNSGLSKSPTKTVRTQSNHFFASIYSYFKLEQLKQKTNLNHFALKSKLYIKALTASFKELQDLRNQYSLATA